MLNRKLLDCYITYILSDRVYDYVPVGTARFAVASESPLPDQVYKIRTIQTLLVRPSYHFRISRELKLEAFEDYPCIPDETIMCE